MASEAKRSSRRRADYLPSLCAMKPAYSVHVALVHPPAVVEHHGGALISLIVVAQC